MNEIWHESAYWEHVRHTTCKRPSYPGTALRVGRTNIVIFYVHSKCRVGNSVQNTLSWALTLYLIIDYFVIDYYYYY